MKDCLKRTKTQLAPDQIASETRKQESSCGQALDPFLKSHLETSATNLLKAIQCKNKQIKIWVSSQNIFVRCERYLLILSWSLMQRFFMPEFTQLCFFKNLTLKDLLLTVILLYTRSSVAQQGYSQISFAVLKQFLSLSFFPLPLLLHNALVALR